MILELKEYIFNKMFSISEEGVQIASIARNMLPYDGSWFFYSEFTINVFSEKKDNLYFIETFSKIWCHSFFLKAT